MAQQNYRPPMAEPLTRRSYQRLPEIERQISEALNYDRKKLMAASDDLAPETLCYFIRRADKQGDEEIRDALFMALNKKCAPFLNKYFKYRGDERPDLTQEVISDMVKHLFAANDIGDFMQVRFWLYLKARTISRLIRDMERQEGTESLNTGYFGDGTSEGYSKLEKQAAENISPVLASSFAQALKTISVLRLPDRKKAAYMDRHYLSLRMGDLERKYNVSGQTIRNWIGTVQKRLRTKRRYGEPGS